MVSGFKWGTRSRRCWSRLGNPFGVRRCWGVGRSLLSYWNRNSLWEHFPYTSLSASILTLRMNWVRTFLWLGLPHPIKLLALATLWFLLSLLKQYVYESVDVKFFSCCQRVPIIRKSDMWPILNIKPLYYRLKVVTDSREWAELPVFSHIDFVIECIMTVAPLPPS